NPSAVAGGRTRPRFRVSSINSQPRSEMPTFLPIEQERRIVNQRPGEVLQADEALVGELVLAPLHFRLQRGEFAVERAVVIGNLLRLGFVAFGGGLLQDLRDGRRQLARAEGARRSGDRDSEAAQEVLTIDVLL